jgi:hypothetical protein
MHALKKMGFIYVIKNSENNMLYVGQTRRNVKIRWTEHKVKSSNRLINKEIQRFGESKFEFIKIEEVENEFLDEYEKNYILEYNSLYPNGYNRGEGRYLFFESSSKGGSSIEGHEKQSMKVKEKYKNNEKLKDFVVPQGISYYKRIKKGILYEGFVVRKKGVKLKTFIYSSNTNKLNYALEKSKEYLTESLNSIE